MDREPPSWAAIPADAASGLPWRDRVAYDETTYLHSLKRRGSPLAHKLELILTEAA